MREFIEELKHNQNINFEKGLENRVDIDYVIERLEEIYILKDYIKNEIDFNIDTLVNDDFLEYDKKEKLYNLNDEEINEISEKILNNDWFIQSINEQFNEIITDELFEKINK